jgi:hypothetical protein
MLPKIVKSRGSQPIIATNEELSEEKAAMILDRADRALALNAFLSRTKRLSRSYSATEASRTGG